jgi:hypothetical protein
MSTWSDESSVAARPDITLKPCASASPEQARDARARAWSYVFECFDRHTKKGGRLLHKGDLDDVKGSRNDSRHSIITDEPNLLGLVRELYSHRPEAYFLEAWELQSLLFLLGYTEALADEAEIDAAIEVARTDWTPEESAA